jgi:hypothetical protein
VDTLESALAADAGLLDAASPPSLVLCTSTSTRADPPDRPGKLRRTLYSPAQRLTGPRRTSTKPFLAGTASAGRCQAGRPDQRLDTREGK